MDNSDASFDWNQARAFLAAAETGSFSAAARALQTTQPTIGRQIAALEQRLQVTLFERAGRRLLLTDAGARLHEAVERMGTAADEFAAIATGQSMAVEGLVRITCTDMVATHHLPTVLKAIRRQAPGIEIELIESNTTADLLRRDADIALRHFRPTQSNLYARLLGEREAAFYASADYLDRLASRPTPDDVGALQLICVNEPERLMPFTASLGLDFRRDQFRVVTSSGNVALALTEAGLGASIMPDDLASRFGLVKVFELPQPMKVPTWLVTHRELQTSPRIRVVFDALSVWTDEHL